MAARFFARRTRKEVSTAAKWEEPILKHTFEGHKNTILDFVFLHDNVHIVSCSWDGTMRKWNRDTGLLVGKPWRAKGGSIDVLALSPDGKTIACGRKDGVVQRWNTNGKMIAGVWTGHSDSVRSLSWSPSGDHLASGSYDGTILIRKAESGQVEVGPIKTEQNRVLALAYSPLGDRIASGGNNKTICIWDTKTGELVVGPIKDLGYFVSSLVWSSDSTKLYSASDRFARVFNSKSGELLHRFKHDKLLYSVALSPKHNVLACVGSGIAQLWDTESLQPLGQPFSQDDKWLLPVSFSPDGHHLAYGGDNKKLTLWSVNDIAPQISASLLLQQSDRHRIQQETRPNSPSSSCLDADATGGDGLIEEGNNDPYNNFFQSSHQSLPSATPGSHVPHLFSARRFLNVFTRHQPPVDESIQKERSKRKFFARRARSNSSLELTTTKPDQPVPEGKAGEGKGKQGDNNHCSANDPLSARQDKGKQRDEPPTDTQSPLSDDSTHPDDLDSKDIRSLWKRMMRARGKDPSDTNIAPAMKRPEVVEVYAVRGFQGYVAMKRARKAKSLAVTGASGVPPICASSSQPGSSSQVVSIQAGPSSHAVVANGAQSSQATGGPSSHAVAITVAQSSQAIGGPSSHASPSHFVTNYHTNHDSDSHTTIEGSYNKFLVWICYPCGRYHNDP